MRNVCVPTPGRAEWVYKRKDTRIKTKNGFNSYLRHLICIAPQANVSILNTENSALPLPSTPPRTLACARLTPNRTTQHKITKQLIIRICQSTKKRPHGGSPWGNTILRKTKIDLCIKSTAIFTAKQKWYIECWRIKTHHKSMIA